MKAEELRQRLETMSADNLRLLETKDRQTWLREYEALRLAQPSHVVEWEKTYEHARTHEELPTWQIR